MMPTPYTDQAGSFSITVTRKPRWHSAMAAVRPPMPPPMASTERMFKSSPGPGAGQHGRLLLGDDIVPLFADSFDYADAHVAGAHPAGVVAFDIRARRAAQGQDVTRVHRHDVGGVGEHLPQVVLHAAGVGV